MIYFYEDCLPREAVGIGRYPYNGTFRFGVRTSVNREGYVFWQIPQEVKAQWNSSRGYYVIAQGSQTAKDVLLHDAAANQGRGQFPNAPQFSGMTGLPGSGDDEPPICPILVMTDGIMQEYPKQLSNSFQDTPRLTLAATLQGHSAQVWSVAFAPDGQTLASSSYDKTIKLWRVSDGVLLNTLTGHTKSVLSVSFSATGRALYSSSNDQTIKIWNPATGQLLGSTEIFNGPVVSVSAAPTESALVAASFDGQAKVLGDNYQGGVNVLTTLSGHTAQVLAATFSPDKKMTATASFDHTIKFWRTDTLIRTLEGHTDYVHSIAFSPNGTILASASGDKTIKLWRVKDGSLIRTLEGHTGAVRSVIFSPDGQVIASASDDRTIRIWNAADGTLLRTLDGYADAVWSVAFSPDGMVLASGSLDGTVRLWKVAP